MKYTSTKRYIPALEHEIIQVIEDDMAGNFETGSIRQKIDPQDPSRVIPGQFLDVVDPLTGNAFEIRVIFLKEGIK